LRKPKFASKKVNYGQLSNTY
ncbi:MAG: hypothetical protein AMXMBFR49_24920, partial [Chlorobiota bacterium]